jgi:hypothetical protein
MKRTNNAAKKFSPAAWQTNPESLKTSQVQFWSASGSMMGLVSLEAAREAVSAGRAFVVCDQAITQI